MFNPLRQITQRIARLPRRTLFTGVAVMAMGLMVANKQADPYFEISKNIDIFSKVLREVHMNFVDEIEPNEFVRQGIDGMLETLDPYSVYISASEIEDYRFMSTGQYGGIGAQIDKNKDIIFIREVYDNRPAQKAGLQPGDIILKIDDEVIEGQKFETSDVRNLLRGQPKTKVVIKVKRYGVAEPLTIEVMREDIKISNVRYAGLVTDDIGYIDLKGFTQEAGKEVETALRDLKQKNPNLKGVILDLRENPGGLLQEAINVSSVFVPNNETIVETKGRMEGSLKVYKASFQPTDLQIPLVVLVNGGSASASEIVSGVMQDLDRGVVIGQKSFGKGLVQTTMNLSYNAQIKLTTARYYTPSGRCIQAVNYTHKDKKGGVIKTPDSLKKQFTTRNGRIVMDGGGIDPDIKVEIPAYHKITKDLFAANLPFDFATYFHSKNASIAKPSEFVLTDAIFDDFVKFVSDQKFEYKSEVEAELSKLRDLYKKEAYYENVESLINQLENSTSNLVDKDIYAHKEEIAKLLTQEIVVRYYQSKGRTEASFTTDPVMTAAIDLLNDKAKYKEILAGNKK